MKGKNILIIDDESGIRSSLKGIFEDEGYNDRKRKAERSKFDDGSSEETSNDDREKCASHDEPERLQHLAEQERRRNHCSKPRPDCESSPPRRLVRLEYQHDSKQREQDPHDCRHRLRSHGSGSESRQIAIAGLEDIPDSKRHTETAQHPVARIPIPPRNNRGRI